MGSWGFQGQTLLVAFVDNEKIVLRQGPPSGSLHFVFQSSA